MPSSVVFGRVAQTALLTCILATGAAAYAQDPHRPAPATAPATTQQVLDALRDAPTTQDEPAATQPAAAAPTPPQAIARPQFETPTPQVEMGNFEGAAQADALLPEVSLSWLAWVAAVIVLALAIQSRRDGSAVRSLDAFVLAATGIALLGRIGAPLIDDGAGPSLQWWCYLLLTIFALYWVGRGIALAASAGVAALSVNMNERGLSVLLIAGLALVIAHLLVSPLSAGARDAVVGGLYTAETGKLPYGDAIGHDARSPLLYLTMAGAARVLPPKYYTAVADDPAPMSWSNRDDWRQGSWAEDDMTSARLVSALFFIATLLAVLLIGNRLHSHAMGLMAAAVLCIFPGAFEGFARPEISLPTALLAWSVALMTAPFVGGFLSMLLIVLAGLAWPWAWLVGLVLMGYWMARGWHAVGAVLGLLLGLAGIGAMLLFMVEPAMPRAGGAVRAAGMTPAYSARLSADDALVIERATEAQIAERRWNAWFWSFLLNRDTATLGETGVTAALPSGVIADQVTFQQLQAGADARQPLQTAYRNEIAEQDELTRMRAATRTVLEATWLPEYERPTPEQAAWSYWADAHPALDGWWTIIRRTAKIILGLLALLAAVLAFRSGPRHQHRALGGVLAVSAAILLVSTGGAATNLLWLMPGVLALFAATSEPVMMTETRVAGPPAYIGDGPRITVNK